MPRTAPNSTGAAVTEDQALLMWGGAGGSTGVSRLLGKPFMPAQLLSRVREVLAG